MSSERFGKGYNLHSKYEHLTLLIKYWTGFPAQQRVSFKQGLITSKILNTGYPQYLESVLIPRLIIIQRGHLIILVGSYHLNQKLFLVNEPFSVAGTLSPPLLSVLLSRLCHFILNLNFTHIKLQLQRQ